MFDDDRLPRYLLHCLPLVMPDLSCHITYWAVIIFLAKLLQQQKCTKAAISCYAESHIPCLAFLFRQGLKSPWYPRNLVWAELSCEGKVMFGKVRKERNLSVKEMLCLEKLIELCRAKDRHCVTRAPLLYFVRSWVALSLHCDWVSQWVRHR